MNYGLYLSAAGTLTSLHRQDVLANNLANLNTVGFKPDLVTNRARLPERMESPGSFAEPQLLLEQLGGGTLADRARIDFRQGAMSLTHNNLDLAIEGDGFFVTSNGKGNGASNLRLTRDGRLTLNASNELVMTASGMRVLDVNDQPIRLDPAAQVRIDADGTIRQNDDEVAQIQITQPADASSITKAGDNLLRFSGKRQPAPGSVRQGALESSAVDPILTLNDMINASKSVQANATMMQYQDHILGQAINTFGRVA